MSTYAALLWWYQSDCRMKPCVQVTLYSIGVTNSSVLAEFNIPITQGKLFSLHSAKSCQLENELLNIDYNSKVGENSFQMCGRGASPESPRSKFTVVVLWDQLTLLLRVYVYEVCHGAQHNCGCLKDEEGNCK